MKDESPFGKIADIVHAIGRILHGTTCRTCGKTAYEDGPNNVPICEECLDLLKDMLKEYKRFREL